MALYRDAPEVRQIALELFASVPEYAELADVRMEFIFRDKAPMSQGRVVLGRARKITGLAAWLAQAGHLDEFEDPSTFFVIEISEDAWKGMDDPARRALVDHELCHCRLDYNDAGELQLKLRGHDFEEFAAIVRRHGLWSAPLRSIGSEVAEQLALALEDVASFGERLVDLKTGEIIDRKKAGDE